MRRRRAWLVWAIGGMLLSTWALLATGARADPPLWRIKGARGSAVLFGSIHLLPPGLAWETPALTTAVGETNELWFEIPIGEAADADAARLLLKRGRLPPGETLWSHLSPDMTRRVEDDAARLGLSADSLGAFQPWLVDATLSIAADAHADARVSEGVEHRLNALAPASARRRGLETAEQQVAILAAGSPADQIRLLAMTLDEIETEPELYQRLVAAWMAGDLAALRKEALDPLSDASPETFQALITSRNRRWARAIERRLESGGRIVVVVGVGHLVGPGGLPSLLRADGLAVEGP